MALQKRAWQLLHEQGLKPGDNIALLADNSLEYLLLAFAAPLAGIRILLISTKVLPEHLRHFLDETNCRCLFYSTAYEGLAANSGYPVEQLQEADEDQFASHAEDFPLDSVAVAEPDEAECALIMHTSGTTDTPRLVKLTHRNIVNNQRAVQNALGEYWTGEDSSLAFLPLFHGYTLFSQILRNIFIGARTVLLQQREAPGAEQLLSALELSKASFFCTVPWMLKLIHEQILADRKRGSGRSLRIMQSMHFVITAGAPLDEETGSFFAGNSIQLVSVFGLTEAAGFVMHTGFRAGSWKHHHPLPDNSIELIKVEGGAGEHELVLHLPVNGGLSGNVEYIDYHSSDIFKSTPEGWFYLGRNDQLYNGPHGEKINPMQFESLLESHPSVAKVYVNGEHLLFNYALVELNSGVQDIDAARRAIRQTIQESINPALEQPARVYPNDVLFLAAEEHLPLTAKGTVERKKARKMLDDKIRQMSLTGNMEDPTDMEAAVLRQIRQYLDLDTDHEIRPDQGLLELGFDSLMLISLRNSLQLELHRELPLKLILNYPKAGDLVQALQRQMPEYADNSRQDENRLTPQTSNGEWTNIPLEQVLFHTASFIFPFPAFNISMSLLAPGRVDRETITEALRFLAQEHEVLRSLYTAEGKFRISEDCMVNVALLDDIEIHGTHDIMQNAHAQELICKYLNFCFDLGQGPVYRYALIHVRNEDNRIRTLLYLGLHHTACDFKGFNALTREMMQILASETDISVIPARDRYKECVSPASESDLLNYRACWQQLLTVMPQLREGLDVRAGHRRNFRYPDIRLDRLAAIFGRHNISLYNGMLTVYALAAGRYLPGQSQEEFVTATAVTSRTRPEIENLTGCFIHSPVIRLCLDPEQPLADIMANVQRTVTGIFTHVITDPADYLKALVANPANLVPFLNRNVFLYRSPEELAQPLPEWQVFRNEFFYDRCDVGMYFDFCANRQDGGLEGYVLINRHYCEPDVIQPILDDMHHLLRQILEERQLGLSVRLQPA